jgi:hypothetical protein
MTPRRTFVAGLAGLAFAPFACPAGSRAETTESSGSPMTAAARHIADAVAAIVGAQLVTRIVWRPPSRFPGFAPLAYYVGLSDPQYPDQMVIWLNPDHPELVSPRQSYVGDDTPLIVELLLASVDLRPGDIPKIGLRELDPSKRRAAAVELAGRVTVVAQFTPYPAVDDTEFARRGFAFAVIRQMTPGIGGVAAVRRPTVRMPAFDPLAYYAGRVADPDAPPGWGVILLVPESFTTTDGYAAYVRAFVLATADLQPAPSPVKRAYDAAFAEDAASHSGEARHTFAAPYVAQVQALYSR